MPFGGLLTVGLISAGAGIYSSNQARKAGQPSRSARAIEEQVADNMRQSSPIGLDFLKGGQANLKLYNDFYEKLARGDRSAALALLAPQFRMADQQNAAALGSELSITPRGGGSAEKRLAGRDALMGQREDNILNLRTSSYDKLGALGGDMASIGNSILGQGSSSGLGLLGAIQNRQNSGFDQARAAGQGLFDVIRLLSQMGSSRGGAGAGAGAQRPGTTSQFGPYAFTPTQVPWWVGFSG